MIIITAIIMQSGGAPEDPGLGGPGDLLMGGYVCTSRLGLGAKVKGVRDGAIRRLPEQNTYQCLQNMTASLGGGSGPSRTICAPRVRPEGPGRSIFTPLAIKFTFPAPRAGGPGAREEIRVGMGGGLSPVRRFFRRHRCVSLPRLRST